MDSQGFFLTQQTQFFFVEDFIIRDLANFNEAKETMSFFLAILPNYLGTRKFELVKENFGK